MTRQAKQSVTFTFVISLSVGVAITMLLSWHIYLVLSAQTTIEVRWCSVACSVGQG